MQLRTLPSWKPESKLSRQHRITKWNHLCCLFGRYRPMESLLPEGQVALSPLIIKCKRFPKEAKSLFAIRHHIASPKIGCRDYWRLLSVCIEEEQILPPSSHCCRLVNFIFISLQINPLLRLFLKHRKRYKISICDHQVRTLMIPLEWGWNKKIKKNIGSD